MASQPDYTHLDKSLEYLKIIENCIWILSNLASGCERVSVIIMTEVKVFQLLSTTLRNSPDMNVNFLD
jgi:hypothetical protein